MKKIWSKMFKKRSSGDQGDRQRLPAVEEQSRSDDFVTKPPENRGNEGVPPSPRLQQLRREGGVVTDNQREIATVTHTRETAQRPFIEDSPDMINIDMNSYGVTRGDHPNPILKTYALASCVGIILHEPTKQLAGGLHLTTNMEATMVGEPTWMSVHTDIMKLLGTMERHGLTYEDRKTLQVSLITSLAVETDLFPIAEERLAQLGIKNIVFKEKEVFEKDRPYKDAKNVAFDSRTGQIYDLSNPNPPKATTGFFYGNLRAGITSDTRSLR